MSSLFSCGLVTFLGVLKKIHSLWGLNHGWRRSLFCEWISWGSKLIQRWPKILSQVSAPVCVCKCPLRVMKTDHFSCINQSKVNEIIERIEKWKTFLWVIVDILSKASERSKPTKGLLLSPPVMLSVSRDIRSIPIPLSSLITFAPLKISKTSVHLTI